MRSTLIALLTAILAQAQSNAVLIKAGRLIDVSAGKTLKGQSILIEGDRIREVGANLTPPAGARVVDLCSFTVLPGLPLSPRAPRS